MPASTKESIEFTIRPSALGLALIAQSSVGVIALFLGDREAQLERDLAARFPAATLSRADARMSAVAKKVLAFIESPSRELDVPVDVRGSDFQRGVWSALRRIPSGETASYTEIAREIGKPTSARAVARACGANPLAVLIPCHRVVRSDGGLSGYRWGVERKRALLALESAAR